MASGALERPGRFGVGMDTGGCDPKQQPSVRPVHASRSTDRYQGRARIASDTDCLVPGSRIVWSGAELYRLGFRPVFVLTQAENRRRRSSRLRPSPNATRDSHRVRARSHVCDRRGGALPSPLQIHSKNGQKTRCLRRRTRLRCARRAGRVGLLEAARDPEGQRPDQADLQRRRPGVSKRSRTTATATARLMRGRSWTAHGSCAPNSTRTTTARSIAGSTTTAARARARRPQAGSPAGVLSRVEDSTRHDGKVSRWEFYEKGQRVRAEEDTDGDGTVDKWETWAAGALSMVLLDTDGNGKPDRRLVYPADGSGPRFEMADANGQLLGALTAGNTNAVRMSQPAPLSSTLPRPGHAALPGTSVLCIGNSLADRSAIAEAAAGLGLSLTWVSGLPQTLAELREGAVAACLLDCTRGGEALRVARGVRTECPRALLIGIVDPARPETTLEAFRAGVFDVLPAPIVAADLRAVISNAQDLAVLADPPDPERVEVSPYGVFGSSLAMRKIVELLPRVAPSRCPVLLYGERGTGREMLARAIHGHARRGDAPFVIVDCASATPQELEHELFGIVAQRRADGIEERRSARAHHPAVEAVRGVGRHALPDERRRDADARAGQAAPRAARPRSGAHGGSTAHRARRAADCVGRAGIRDGARGRTPPARPVRAALARCGSSCRRSASGARTCRSSPRTSSRSCAGRTGGRSRR